MLSQDLEMLKYVHAVPGRVYEAHQTADRSFSVAKFHSTVQVIAVTVLAVLGIFYILNGFVAQKSYEMQGIRAEIIALEKSNETARLEVARLESPARIQAIAETHLGMHVPHEAIYGSGESKVSLQTVRD